MDAAIEAVVQLDGGRGWRLLTRPTVVIEVHDVSFVAESLRQVETLATSREQHAVGFVRYEAAEAFGLVARPGECLLPLVWFAFFAPSEVKAVERPPTSGSYETDLSGPSTALNDFREGVRRVRDHLANGNTYHLHYTFKARGRFRGDPLAFFADLSRQQTRYATFIRTGRWTVCSASPELFLHRDADRVTARPAKGTVPRGRFPEEDRQRADALGASATARAANALVVGVVRSDLERVAEPASVAAPASVQVERCANVWQLTSTVEARTHASLADLFAATFPPASTTGAPKRRTTEIIAEIEREPRGLHTGVVGWVRPDGNAQFAVANRTVVIDRHTGTFEVGVGGAIAWDSDPDREYAACLREASVLSTIPSPFQLLETLAWDLTRGFWLLERHLARLEASADYFQFEYRSDRTRAALTAAVAEGNGPLRVRLLLAETGEISVETAPLELMTSRFRVALAASPIDPLEVFLFHKTTNRAIYERLRVAGVDDVILWNPKGEVTESTIANIVAEIDGRLVTPPVGCGLLAGTFRAELLDAGEVVESILTVEQLQSAPRVWLVNSVRGWCPADVVASPLPRSRPRA